MTDFLRSILQTAHNASPQTAQAATAAATVKTEVRPVDQIQVPPSACTLGVSADATASLLAMEKQRMIKVEIPDTSSTVAGTNIAGTADASKAQRAARRDVVNARRETKRKTMSSSSDSDDCASGASSPRADVDMTPETAAAASATAAALPLEKSKKMKTGKTTSAPVPATTDAADVKTAKKSSASSPLSSSSSSSMLFGSEIDALGEERLRAMEAQLESLDPDSKEAKKKRRLIRNRMSAQLHRERKKAYVGQLEDQLLEKERELQALQDKLNALANESLLMKQQLAQTQAAAAPAVAAAPVTPAPAAAAAIVQIEDDVVIKAEPIVDVASAFDVPPTPVAAASAKDSWDYCFPNLDDAEMADVAADDLLRDFDHPFAAYAAAMASEQKEHVPAHHEIHAAKKNIVMVMGMMFSATFFGNSPFFFDVQSGSTFSSYFQANPPKELSQFNVASKIMTSLEKSSWKDFRDIASWTSAPARADATTDAADADAPRAAASPSAASDITDSSGMCDSPAQQIDDCLGLTGLETDLIDEFVYPVDDPFAPALADTNWFGDDADDFGQSDVDDADDDIASTASHALSASNVAAASAAAAPKTEATPSITSRLFDKLTALWHEKNQVLLTVLDGKNEVTRRSVADMSAIRESMANGSIFAAAAAAPHASAAPKTSPLGTDESVSFLYPLSAFSPAVEPTDPDAMFLEVSCQMSALSM